eukprot:g3675.t1
MPSGYTRTCINGPPNNNPRCWWTYVPYAVKTDSSETKVPLVIDMHGGGGCAAHQALASGFKALSDTLGKNAFITVWPQGHGTQWGSCGSDCDDIQKEEGKDIHKVDDLTFLTNMLATIVKSQSDSNPAKGRVDAERVYATGFSMGCMMSHRLALEKSTILAGFGCHGGTLNQKKNPDLSTEKARFGLQPMPAFLTGGTDDQQSLLSVQGASLLAKEKASGRSGETRVQSKKKSKRKKHSSTDEFTTAHQQELWMGGIPSNYATEKAVSRILWGNIRSGEPVPVVKIVVRKGWRGKRTGASDEGGATREKQWVGYAIIAFATEEDAAKALTLFQGRKLEEGFTMRLKPAQPRKRLRRGPGGEGAKSSQGISFAPLNPEEDPPLESQLMPLRTEQLVQRLSSLQKFYDSFMADTKFPGKDTKRRIEQIATCTPMLRAEDTDGSMRKRLAMYHASVS